MTAGVRDRASLREALAELGIDRLVLSIHDVSFPAAAGADAGFGSPYSRAAHDFLGWARDLGFDGLQLGPQGQTSRGNPSPYDGSVFSRSVLALPLAALADARFLGLVPGDVVVAEARGTPAGDTRAHYTHAFRAHHAAALLAADELSARAQRGEATAVAMLARIEAYAAGEGHGWLEHDAAFEAFAARHPTDDFRTWPDADRAPTPWRIAEITGDAEGRRIVRAYRFAQWALAELHETWRAELAALGMRAYGDLQVGISLRDRWRRESLFLPRWVMGAPPSRTNPEGQPWGYPVLDPRTTAGVDGEGRAFVRARVAKLLRELDGVRIDHPHGLVCPWVYDGDAPDAAAAVRAGARLFESPEHPALGAFAIARREQIDRGTRPYDDERTHDLDAAQIDAYARLIDVVMEEAEAAGRSARDVLCEVLSTCPHPLACVMKRHDLGRFRVTQKASLVDPEDGYRGENAAPNDWTMIGNHDTEPLQRVLDRWSARGGGVGAGGLADRAAYLATRLERDPSRRESFAASLVASRGAMTTAMFAELLVGPARNVLVFWADVFGERDVYNTPGVPRAENWTMRVPARFRDAHAAAVARGEGLDLGAAIAMARAARGLV